MQPPIKLTYEALVDGMSPFLHFPTVEQEMQAEKQIRVQDAFSSTLFYSVKPSPAEDMRSMLDVKTADEYEKRLRLILAITQGSLETLDRVCMILCPEQKTWKQRFQSSTATRAIIEFLQNPTSRQEIPRFVSERFTTKFFEIWIKLSSSAISDLGRKESSLDQVNGSLNSIPLH